MVVLEVGARSATVGRWRVFDQNLRYLGFEPDRQECERLNAAVERSQSSWQERYYPIALGSDRETRQFYITASPYSSSLLEPNLEALDGFHVASLHHVQRTTQVETSSLSQWAQDSSVGAVDFIKLDVQGAELEILQGGEGVVDSALGLEVEVEFIAVYRDQPRFSDVDAWIHSQGFLLFDLGRVYNKRACVPEQVESHGQLTWGDALYLRDVDSLFGDSQPDDARLRVLRLFKLAAIADLYTRPDYALYVLEKAVERYPEHLGEYRELVAGAISEIEKRLRTQDKTRHKIREMWYNSRLRPLLSLLFPNAHERERIQAEVRRRGYRWKEQSW